MAMKSFGFMLVSIFLLSFLLHSPLPTNATSEEEGISFDSLCKKTDNVTFCKEILRDPQITETMDYKQLAPIVFDKAVEHTQKNINYMMAVAVANSAKAYIFCADGYETAVASFKDGRSELEKDIKKAKDYAVEARDGPEVCRRALARSELEDSTFDHRSLEIKLYSDLCSAITKALMKAEKSH